MILFIIEEEWILFVFHIFSLFEKKTEPKVMRNQPYNDSKREESVEGTNEKKTK